MNAVHRVVPEVGKSRLLLRKRTLLKQRIIDGSHTTSRSPVFGELLWRVGGIGAADQCHRTTGHRARRDQRTRHRHARQEPAERSRVSWPPVTSRSLRAPHGASRAGGGAHHASTPDTLSPLSSPRARPQAQQCTPLLGFLSLLGRTLALSLIIILYTAA